MLGRNCFIRIDLWGKPEVCWRLVVVELIRAHGLFMTVHERKIGKSEVSCCRARLVLVVEVLIGSLEFIGIRKDVAAVIDTGFSEHDRSRGVLECR